MLNWLSRNVFHPLWDLKDSSVRLRTARQLEVSQWLPLNHAREIQWQKLKAIVAYAYANCAYYKRVFDQASITVSVLDGPDAFLKVPVLTKQDIRQHGDELLSREYEKGDLCVTKTGGSTGTALKLYFDKTCDEVRNAAAIRSNTWANWRVGDPIGALWGNPEPLDTWKKRIRQALHDRVVVLDTVSLSDESMLTFVQQWRMLKPRIMFGHSHSLYMFAKFLERKGIVDIRPSGIVATSMMLLSQERAVIERVMACPVTNRYGCEEVGLIACECEKHNGLHINVESVYVELLGENGRPVAHGDEGHIVVTDLVNHAMPLIRYRVEDLGVSSSRRCPCGRGLPLMEKVVGRTADFLVKLDGTLVAGVSLIERTLTAIPGIEQMQIIQEGIHHITINLVPSRDYTVGSEQRLRQEITIVFGGEVQCDIRFVSRIKQDRSGKYRFAICKVPKTELRQTLIMS